MKAFICYFSSEQKQALSQLAKKKDRSIAEMVRRAVDDFLERQNCPSPEPSDRSALVRAPAHNGDNEIGLVSEGEPDFHSEREANV